MKQGTFWLIVAATIILAYAFYRSRHRSSDLNVEPHAAKEIEKAQRRIR